MKEVPIDMEICQYTPDLLTPLTQFYNYITTDVPHCYPIKDKELETSLNNNSDIDEFKVFVALTKGAVQAFIHVRLCKNNRSDEKEGYIRFFSYERGARRAGQTVLEKAEEYIKSFNVSRINAFTSGDKYPFYHLEYANLSTTHEHVYALLGANGYVPKPQWVFLDWENFEIPPISSPIPVKLSVYWKHGHGELPDCNVEAYIDNEEVGSCCSVSGAEFSKHPNAQDWCFTTWLEVEREFQGHGLGKFLLQYSLQEMQHVGYRHASVSTSYENYRAILLYTNCGYRVVDCTNQFQKDLS